MPSHKEVKNLDYNAKQILDLVMNIEDYPKFLPWCVNAKIINQIDDNSLEADLYINFKGLFQKYRSHVTLKKLEDNVFEIKAEAISGPFKNLVNYWRISQINGHKNRSNINFFIDFEFKSKLLNKIIGPIFERATSKMINAFEQRAILLYE